MNAAHSLTSAELIATTGRIPPIIGTASGGCFHVLDPQDDEVHLGDIAHHLAHIGRYTGACSQLWSVGSHSIEVATRIALRGGTFTEQLQGLLHDASEAYLVDIPRPFKPDVYFRRQEVGGVHFESYYEVENRVMRCIFRALDVPYPFSSIVGQVDESLMLDEVANFFRPGFIWDRYEIRVPKTGLHIAAARSPQDTALAFIELFENLVYCVDRYES